MAQNISFGAFGWISFYSDHGSHYQFPALSFYPEKVRWNVHGGFPPHRSM